MAIFLLFEMGMKYIWPGTYVFIIPSLPDLTIPRRWPP